MKQVSIKRSPLFIKTVPLLWLAIMLFDAVALGFNWLAFVSFLLGGAFFTFIFYKFAEVYVDGDRLIVVAGNGTYETSLENIEAPIEKTLFLRSSYRINFKQPFGAGKFVVFMSRSSFLFWENEECKKFLKLINI